MRDTPRGERTLDVPAPPRRSMVDDPRLRARLKTDLRRQMKAVRGALPAEARARRSACISSRVQALEAWASSQFVAAFASIRSEVQTHELVREALQSTGRVAFPRLDTELGEIVLHEARDTGELRPSGAFNIPEPSPDAPLAALDAIDFVLVPALALDPTGRRIGYGRGYYDRLLTKLPNALRVAVAYDFQLLAEIPDEPHDERVHFVVTDSRTIDVRAESER